MSKTLAIFLPLLWLIFLFFPEWKFAWLIKTSLGLVIGGSIAHLWKYDDLKEALDITVHMYRSVKWEMENRD